MANLFRCAGGGEDIKCIERPYDISKTYNAGDTVLYNGLLRICTANGVTGDFNESKWEVTTLEELLGENAGESATFVDYIASEYDPTHTYAAGDAILGDNGEILKCLEDEVTGEFDNSKWSRDYLCNLSGNVNSNLGNDSIFSYVENFTKVSTSEWYFLVDNSKHRIKTVTINRAYGWYMSVQKSDGTKLKEVINGGGSTLPVTVDVSDLESFRISSTATQNDHGVVCYPINNDTISFN